MEWTTKQIAAMLAPGVRKALQQMEDARELSSFPSGFFSDERLMKASDVANNMSEIRADLKELLPFKPGQWVVSDKPSVPGMKCILPGYLREIDNDFMQETFAPLGKGPIDPHMAGAKLDAGKNRLGLVLGSFAKALFGVGEIGTFGANKYSDNGWKSVEDGVNRYTDALLRHLFSYLGGEKCDPETKKPHLWHAAWNILAIIELTEKEDAERKIPCTTGSVKTGAGQIGLTKGRNDFGTKN